MKRYVFNRESPVFIHKQTNDMRVALSPVSKEKKQTEIREQQTKEECFIQFPVKI